MTGKRPFSIKDFNQIMPLITITFNYPHAPLPKFKFGDRVALSDDCPPCDWLTGKVVGLTLDESYDPTWYYSVKLDAPSGLTEEYLECALVPEKEIPVLQAGWKSVVSLTQKDEFKPSPFDNCDYDIHTADAVWAKETLGESY